MNYTTTKENIFTNEDIEIKQNDKDLYICPFCNEVIGEKTIGQSITGTKNYDICLNGKELIQKEQDNWGDNNSFGVFYCKKCNKQIDIDWYELKDILLNNKDILLNNIK